MRTAPSSSSQSRRGHLTDARAGFTLLETMVALAILGTGVAAVLGLLGDGLAATRRTHTRTLLTELADARMESLLLEGEGAAEGRFEPPNHAIRWRTRTSRGPVAGTVLLEVSVVGEGDSVHLATLGAR